MPVSRISLMLCGVVVIACVVGRGLCGEEQADEPRGPRLALVSWLAEERRLAMFVMDEVPDSLDRR
jgi:hypothetical protein